MNSRMFGATGRSVSEVGLGTWQLGAGWGDVPEADALATLRAAWDGGVRFFDTADVYGAGRSESLIGRFLRETPSAQGALFVATKLGRGGDPGWPGNFTRAAVRAHTEASLWRLGVEALDLTQLHCVPADLLARGELFGWLGELQIEGKIKSYGASVESMEEAATCVAHEGCAALQIIFNLFRQKPIHTLFGPAQAAGKAIIVRLPLASGVLAGKMSVATKFAVDDHRHFNRDGQSFNVGETFAGLPFTKAVELTEQLRSHVPTDLTMAEFALRWVLDHPAVTTIIPGARNPDQVRRNLRSAELASLGEARHAALAKFYDAEVAAHIRGPY